MEIPVNHGLPDGPGSADVHDQTQNNERVAQHGGQQGRPDDGLEIVFAEDVRQKRRGESAGCQRHARGDIDTDPDSPGSGGAQVGYIADAADEPRQHGDGAGAHQKCHHEHAGGPERSPDRIGMSNHG